MSVIFVFVGQCGNQIGMTLMNRLRSQPTTLGIPGGVYVAPDGFARCVLVDTEPKVVTAFHASMPTFIRRENVVFEQSGRGNNWAHGYYGPAKKIVKSKGVVEWQAPTRRSSQPPPPVLNEALRRIHAEVHRSEFGIVETIVVVHSVAGGTGSGLGARILECVKRWHTWDGEEGEESVVESTVGQRCKALYLVSVAVLPFESVSDVSVQYINMSLCLSCVMPLVDAIVLLRNSFSSKAATSSLQTINEHYADVILGLMGGGGFGGVISERSVCVGEGIILVPGKEGGVHVPSIVEIKDIFRAMLRDVALKLLNKAYLFQYTRHDGMTEEIMWQSLRWMRALIPP